MRRAAKVDANQAEIVEFLRKNGATVQSLGAVGKGCPDLLIGYMGKNILAEVKDGKNGLNTEQIKWHNGWNGQITVIRSVEDAGLLLKINR